MSTAGAPLVRAFADIGLNDRPAVGGKGASLGELTGAGIPAPPGFVVTVTGFERFLHALDPQQSIRAAIEKLDPNNLDELTKITRGIRDRIERAALSGEVRDAVIGAYRALMGDSPFAVAVRSSATSEDSADASFAGLQDTYLWVRDEDSMAHAICRCWASLYSSESVSYRLRLKLPEENVAMAVVVQRMVDSHCSGVMFTRSPTTGDRSVIAIEGSWGLGSCIVSGEVTPDKYVVNKVTGEILKRTVSHKTMQHVPDRASGGVLHVEVEADRQLTPCLSDDDIAALAAMGKRIEQHYGSPQDIEWAITTSAGGSALYILQSRPETIWSSKEAQPVAKPMANPFDHVLSALSGFSGR